MILLDYVLLLGALAWVGTSGRRWRIPPSLQTPLRALAVLLVALTLGALVYLFGIGVWRGRAAQVCRVAGWGAMAAALAVPSTLSLALPLLVVLAPTLAPPRVTAP